MIKKIFIKQINKTTFNNIVSFVSDTNEHCDDIRNIYVNFLKDDKNIGNIIEIYLNDYWIYKLFKNDFLTFSDLKIIINENVDILRFKTYK